MSSSEPGPLFLKGSTARDRTIRLLMEATASQTGEAFFKSLVKHLAQLLGTSAAWVTRYDAERNWLNSLAMYVDGEYVDEYNYAVSGTPCESVVRSCGIAHFSSQVVELFPNDPDLAPLNAVSYIGAPMVGRRGELLGHVAAIDSKPMPDRESLYPIIELFALRACAEIERMEAEATLRSREEQLGCLIDTAMDAVLILDRELKILRVNASACGVFGCEEEDLLEESLLDFLQPRGGETIRRLLAGFTEENGKAWIPEGFEALSWHGRSFEAEATLSRFRVREDVLYALILRNVEERLEAKRRIVQLSQEAEYMRSAIAQTNGEIELIGWSQPMRRLLEGIDRVAKTDASVLVLGETGTGKELVARSLHGKSLRKHRPLVCVNCGAIPESLIESEFFGHEKGAFTGAGERRLGKFERAHGGTLFLDEIGELNLTVQAKLLRVLQEGEFERLGGAASIKVDVRIVAATHRDLVAMVAEGAFREDLYYRLNVFPLVLPPLRERGREVVELARAFLARLGAKMGRHFAELTEQDAKLLESYDWPGNVRELQNVIERAIIQSPGRTLSLIEAMPTRARAIVSPPPSGSAAARVFSDAELRELEKANLVRALAEAGGAVFGPEGAAKRLGIKPTTLVSRLKKFGIPRDK